MKISMSMLMMLSFIIIIGIGVVAASNVNDKIVNGKSIKVKNSVDLELIKNTETCGGPIECYAIVSITPTKTNINIPNSANANFRLNLLNPSHSSGRWKEGLNSKITLKNYKLNDFKIEVLEEYNTENQTSKSYYGYKFKKGNTSYIKISGEKDNTANVDWGFNFMGVDLGTEWAWWNMSYPWKTPLYENNTWGYDQLVPINNSNSLIENGGIIWSRNMENASFLYSNQYDLSTTNDVAVANHTTQLPHFIDKAYPNYNYDSYDRIILTDNIYHWVPMSRDGLSGSYTAYDVAKNLNATSYIQTVTPVSGIFGEALQFTPSGGTEYLEFASGGTVDNITASAWIYITNNVSTGTFISLANTYFNRAAFEVYVNGTGNVIFKTWDNGGPTSQETASITTIPNNVWTFVTVMHNRTHDVIYINGTQDASSPAAYNLLTSGNSALLIGCGQRNIQDPTCLGGTFFDGYIDNVIIYDNDVADFGLFDDAWVMDQFMMGVDSYLTTGNTVNFQDSVSGDGYDATSIWTGDVYELSENLYNLTVNFNQTVVNNVTANIIINGTIYAPTTTIIDPNTTQFNITNIPLKLWSSEDIIYNHTWYYDIGYVNGSIIPGTNLSNSQFTKFSYALDTFTLGSATPLIGETINFTTNVTNTSSLANINIIHEFNNTNYTASVSGSDYVSSIQMPDAVDTFTPRSILNLTYGAYARESNLSSSLTTQNFNLTECTSGAIALNFTIYDEPSRDVMNGTISASFINWATPNITTARNFELTGNNTYQLCISPTDRSFFTNATIRYKSDNHTDYRFYYLRNFSLSNSTEDIGLYSLSSGNSTFAQVLVQDASQSPLAGRQFRLQRFYEDLGTYITIAMGETNNEGIDIINYKANDVLYRFVVLNGQTVVEVFDGSKYSTTSIVLTVQADLITEFYSVWNQITASCTNTTTDVTCNVIDGSGKMVNWRLVVDVLENADYTLACDDTTTGSSLTCNVTAETGKTLIGNIVRAKVIVEFQDTLWLMLTAIFEDITKVAYGIDGVLVSLFIIIFMASIGILISPDATILLSGVGFITSYLFGFLDVTQTSIGVLVVVIALFIYKSRSGK